MPTPRVAHACEDAELIAFDRFGRDAHFHLAALGEFHRIGQQIHKHLAVAKAIAAKACGYESID
jgi:hypothetical protein